MKIIPSHKGNLRTAADVVRMVRYIYGKNRSKVLATITNEHYPGIVTGDPRIDSASLTACHPGGRAGVCRNIVMSSSYFPTRKGALDHLEGIKGVVSGFMDKWLPHTPTLSVVHISEGKARYKGQWRLDAHILPVNHDLKTGMGLQFSRKDTKAMQSVEDYVPKRILNQYSITRGKGNGEMTRPRGALIYPYSVHIASLEVGKLTEQDLNTYVEQQGLITRRRKDGTIISVTTATGRKLNVRNARATYTHVTGGTCAKDGIVHQQAQSQPADDVRVVGIGRIGSTNLRFSEAGPGHLLSPDQNGNRLEPEDFFERRSRRLLRSECSQQRGAGLAVSGPRYEQNKLSSVAGHHSTRSVLKYLGQIDLSRGIAELESIRLF